MRCWWPTKSLTSQDQVDQIVNAYRKIEAAEGPFDGILGFSQGAACALVLLLLQQQHVLSLHGLQFVILAGGYLPDCGKGGWRNGVPPSCRQYLNGCKLASLHICGRQDKLISVAASRQAASRFSTPPTIYEHGGSHCFPQKAADVAAVLSFLDRFHNDQKSFRALENAPSTLVGGTGTHVAGKNSDATTHTTVSDNGAFSRLPNSLNKHPDRSAEEIEELQSEIEALQACFPEEFEVLKNGTDEPVITSLRIPFTFPSLAEKDIQDRLAIAIQIPGGYPTSTTPYFEFQRCSPTNRSSSGCLWEFAVSSSQYCDFPRACIASADKAVREIIEENAGECVLLQMVLTAQDAVEEFMNNLDATPTEPAAEQTATSEPAITLSSKPTKGKATSSKPADVPSSKLLSQVQTSNSTTDWWNEEQTFMATDPDDADIATHLQLVEAAQQAAARFAQKSVDADLALHFSSAQHGAWNFVVGLVGKPSAGKSTFFNAASR